MRVEIHAGSGKFHYNIIPEQDDKIESERLLPVRDKNIKLVNFEYDVTLPPSFNYIHPDMHAAAIFTTLRPFMGKSLTLPFPVSERFATLIHNLFYVKVTNTSPKINPRKSPKNPTPCLLFSGGMDSVAASLVMPDQTAHLFLDRIPHYGVSPNDDDVLIDPVRARDVCRLLEDNGKHVHIMCDDHEFLYRPYPIWHSEMSIMPALYLADSLNISTFDRGFVLGTTFLHGYLSGEINYYGFKKTCNVKNPADIFNNLGLSSSTSIAGLSEAATAMIVHKSHFKGKTASCYFKSDGFACMRCDKCFRKVVLMDHIIEDREVPCDIIDQFLSYPHIAEIFRKKYFDWHHEWIYVFQKIKCSHPFITELQKQAKKAADLSFLEKWYPYSRSLISINYRDYVENRVNDFVNSMTEDEIQIFENLRLPPLYAPELPHPAYSYAKKQFREKDENLTEDGNPVDPEIKSLLEKFRDSAAIHFAGYSVKSTEIHPGGRALIFFLQTQESRENDLILEVEIIKDQNIKYYRKAGNLAVSYRKETPITGTEREKAMDAFVDYLSININNEKS
jgi:hypothetical protein